MILAMAVVAGLAAGLLRARLKHRTYNIPSLRVPILIVFAFAPQLLAFYLARAGVGVADRWAPVILVSSQILLLAFVWANRKMPWIWLLGLGLLLNFLVIVLNGGLMPISPETVRRLYPNVPESKWQIGKRLGTGKDIVLLESTMHLPLLADRWLLPQNFPVQVAFSAGDVLLALGAFLFLWSLGGQQSVLLAKPPIVSFSSI